MNRRLLVIGSAAALLTALPAATRADPAPRSTGTPCVASHGSAQITDFDGDGRADLAIGVPGASSDAGGVEVREATRRLFLQPGTGGIPGPPAAGDGFGSAVLAANLDGDHCTDLLVGMPGLTVDGLSDAGGVQLLYGTPTGFEAGPLLTRDSDGVAGAAASGEHFGASLAASTGMNDTGSGQFVEVGVHVGAPEATVTTGSRIFHSAGSVIEIDYNQLPGTRLGAPVASTEMWQGNGIGGSPVVAAHLGAVMSDRLVAAPDETLSHRRFATGFVSRANYAFDAAGGGFAPLAIRGQHAGERLGSGLDRMCTSDTALIGAPGRKLGGHAQAGDVVIIKHLDKAPKMVGHVNQKRSRIPGAVSGHHQFGAALGSACGVEHGKAVADLTIGAPGTTVDGHLRAGAVVLLRVDPKQILHILKARLVSRRSKHVAGNPAGGDQFGATLQTHAIGAASSDQTLVGVPYDDLGAKDAGSVDQLAIRLTSLAVLHSTSLHRKNGSESDRYGGALAQ